MADMVFDRKAVSAQAYRVPRKSGEWKKNTIKISLYDKTGREGVVEVTKKAAFQLIAELADTLMML